MTTATTMMTSATSAPEILTLKGGLCVSLLALQLAWRLEDRGCSLRVADDGVGLIVRPRRLLTTEDDAEIRRHRIELMAIVRYCEGIQ